MAATNVQAFPGDVTISSNLAVDTNTLFVDSVGNKVGIGEVSPTQLLHVRGTGPQFFIEGVSNEPVIIRGSSGPLYRDKYHEIAMGFYALPTFGSSNYIDFKVNEGGESNSPSTRMRIRGDGNVGIGTDNPANKLTVVATTAATDSVLYPLALRAISSGTVADGFGVGIQFESERADTDSYTTGAGAIDVYGQNIPGTSDLWNMRFKTRNNDTTTTAMTLKYDGLVGIGTDTPVATLDVAGSANSGKSLQLRSGDTSASTDSAQIIFSHDGNPYNSGGYAHSIRTRHNTADAGNAIDFWCWNTTDTTNADTLGNKRVMTIEGTGNVGIGTDAPGYKLHVVGDIYSTGNITAYSDKRAKENIEKIENALDKVCTLGGYTYTMKGQKYTGLIAQEVLEVLPEAVTGSEETNYALAYGNMMGLIVEAIKELKEKIG